MHFQNTLSCTQIIYTKEQGEIASYISSVSGIPRYITMEVAGSVPPHTILANFLVTVISQHENVLLFHVFFFRVEHACLKPYVPYRLSII
jgi:hypothetical protein